MSTRSRRWPQARWRAASRDCPTCEVRDCGDALGPRRLGLPGLGAEKVPKDEAQNGQQDDQDCPEDLSARIRAALENVHDRPDVGDQYDQTTYTLILHASPFLMEPVLNLNFCLKRHVLSPPPGV